MKLNNEKNNELILLSEEYSEYYSVNDLNTPFTYSGGKIVPDEKNVVVEWGNFRQAEDKEQINSGDKIVINKLRKYGILTSALMQQACANEEFCSERRIHNLCKKLLKLGVFHRYRIVAERGLNFYVLSDAGLKYAEKLNKHSSSKFDHLVKSKQVTKMKASDFSNIGSILAKLALTQMEINYERRLPLYKSINKPKNKLDRIRTINLSNHNMVTFFCVRRDQRLDKLIKWIDNNHDKSDEIILHVEDNYHAMSIINNIHDKISFDKILFVTDLVLVEEFEETCYLGLERYSDTKHGLQFIPYSTLKGFSNEQ